MRVGIPREIKSDEYRVATVPSAVRAFTGAGHEILVEHGAGLGSGITDAELQAAGARLCERAELFATSDMIMKVKEPFLIAGGDFSGYDINVSVRGGGRIGQAEAIKVAIASGMAKINPSLAAKFLAYDRNLLVADPRRTEPHKPPRSSKGARRHKQRSKR